MTNCKPYHKAESVRIAFELANLIGSFAEDGVVKTVLRQRIEQERRLAEGKENCYCNVGKDIYEEDED